MNMVTLFPKGLTKNLNYLLSFLFLTIYNYKFDDILDTIIYTSTKSILY